MKIVLSFLLTMILGGPLISQASCDPCICGLGGGKPPPVECMFRPQPVILSCQSDEYKFSLTRFHGALYANLVSSPGINPTFAGRTAVRVIPSDMNLSSHLSSEDGDVDVQVNFDNLSKNSVGSVLIRKFNLLSDKTIVCKASPVVNQIGTRFVFGN